MSGGRLGPSGRARGVGLAIGSGILVYLLIARMALSLGGATPTLTTTASAATEVGLQIFDTAVLAGGNSPTGTITFTLYGPGDTSCATAIFTSPVTVTGNATYDSQPFTTSQAGTYRWRASYGGDANNTAVSTACNDPNESVIVGKASVALTTAASGPVALGSPITDTATISGGLNPTGTVSFFLYSPTDQFCSAAALFQSDKAVNGNGHYTSDPFTPTAAGTYKWRASYSGDANNLAVTVTACNDPAEASTVTSGGSTTTSTTSPSTTTTAPSTTSSTTSTTVHSTTTTGPTATSSTVASTTSSTAPATTTTTAPATTTTATPASTTTLPATTSTTAAPGSTTTTAVPPSTTTLPTVPSTQVTSTTLTSSTTATSTSTTSTTVAGQPTVTVTPNTVAAGQNATVAGSNFPAGQVDVDLFSTPVLLTRVTVGASGSFSAVVTIPVDTAPGSHRIVVAGAGGATLAEVAVTVTAPMQGAAQRVNTVPLSRTGTNATAPAEAAVALLGAGGLLVRGARRRSASPAACGPRRRRCPWD